MLTNSMHRRLACSHPCVPGATGQLPGWFWQLVEALLVLLVGPAVLVIHSHAADGTVV